MSKDKNIWESYTQSVRPARKKKTALPKSETKKPVPETRSKIQLEFSSPVSTAARAALSEETLSLPALERKREKNMRQGNIEIDGKIDLHGMTQSKAFDSLAAFMQRQVKANKRHLLIVTGKGRSGEGVLRRNLKNWLSQLPESKSILALRPAAPQHGGDGAFYVVLRKPKAAKYS